MKNYNKKAKNAIGAHAQYLTERSIAAHASYTVRAPLGHTAKDDLVALGHGGMPAWAQSSPLAYWEMADKYSQANACLGKELLVTLPYELSALDNQRLVETFLARLPRVPITWALHAPLTRDGQHTQYHCHIVLSPRQDDGLQRTPQAYFQRTDRGGTTQLRLYTRPADLRAIRGLWQGVLQDACRAHGLTLDRPYDGMKEIRLTWQELRHLRQVLHQHGMPGVWGHEHRLPLPTLLTWQRTGTISRPPGRVACAARTAAILQTDCAATTKVWGFASTLRTARPTQVVLKHKARQGLHQAEAAIKSLQEQRHQLSQVYMTWINPALKQAQARYRETHSRVLTRGRHQAHERSGDARPLDLPVLDAALRERERRREQERGR